MRSPCPSWASAISLLCFSKASSMAFLFTLSWNKNHVVSKPHSHPRQHSTSTHIARGVRHGRTPLHRLRCAGSHGFRPAVVELACHRCLIATSWPDCIGRRHLRSVTTLIPSLGWVGYAKSLLFMEFKICQLHWQLDERVRMQLFLFDSSFSKSREGVAHNLQVLSLENRRLLVRQPHWQLFSISTDSPTQSIVFWHGWCHSGLFHPQ